VSNQKVLFGQRLVCFLIGGLNFKSYKGKVQLDNKGVLLETFLVNILSKGSSQMSKHYAFIILRTTRSNFRFKLYFDIQRFACHNNVYVAFLRKIPTNTAGPLKPSNTKGLNVYAAKPIFKLNKRLFLTLNYCLQFL